MVDFEELEPGTTEYETAWLRDFPKRKAATRRGLLTCVSCIDFYSNYLKAAKRRVNWGKIDRRIAVIEAEAMYRRSLIEAR